MNAIAGATTKPIKIGRPDREATILRVFDRTHLAIKAGSVVDIDGVAHAFEADTPVTLEETIAGRDYGVAIDGDGKPFAEPLLSNPLDGDYFAGFHFAPGGCADARAGGDTNPGINPHSIWDIGFRPSCPDPRGMTLVGGNSILSFWADIYLLCTNHQEEGTSRLAMEIADGDSLDRLNYKDAVEIYAAHGKRLLTYDEFRVAALGVTERSSAEFDPEKTALDAARTSRFGLMQAIGNLWVWGTDGDPEDPRPSIFGGSWINGSLAGSRGANLACWPGHSYINISARGASDHLIPA